ncbi:hypothetical protein [Pseudorhodoplanes sp.]|uniref:hypothetical protein n=1 Tax=Pseudorhodoplanes sp. TaxID=1934341 RepID=UPI002B5B6BEC|nr:hypothetical protein [Pseudorhodoplanes sp.]HWV42021.1 hypothetical protein [Pseudorhodoplanes sp.]
MLFLNYIGLALCFSAAAILVSFALKLLRADRIEAKKSASRVDGLADVLMGRAKTRDDWLPDGRIKGGMIFNKSKNRIEICGRLSDEAFNRIFR